MQDLIRESERDTISYLSWETMNATMGTCGVWTRKSSTSQPWYWENEFLQFILFKPDELFHVF